MGGRFAGIALALAITGTGLVSTASAKVDQRDSYAGHRLVRVQVTSRDTVDALQAMGLDLWTERPGPGVVLVRVPPRRSAALEASGIPYTTVVADLGTLVELEQIRLEGRPPPTGTGFYSDFRTFDEIEVRLDEIAASDPQLVEIVTAGSSLEGRPIRGVRIAGGDDKPIMFVNAGQHAREWIAMMSGICVAESFVTRADEPQIAALLDQIEIIVVPVVNPDGYVYSWESERFWRKNRRDGVGVDTNRNFGVAWGAEGASPEPEAGNYHGEAAFSEPEVEAMRDLFDANPDIVSHVDVHSYGQLVLYPWSHTEDEAPAAGELQDVAVQMADKLTDTHGETYTPMQGSMLYPASGTFPDWAYGDRGAYAFTYELRPTSEDIEQFTEGFLLPPEEIPLVCEETMEALLLLAQWTADATPGMPGDDGGASTSGGDTTGGSDGSGGGSSGTTAQTSGTSTSAETFGGTTGGLGTSDESGSDGGDGDATDGGGGCGCRQRAARDGAWLLGVLPLFLRRRRTIRGRIP